MSKRSTYTLCAPFSPNSYSTHDCFLVQFLPHTSTCSNRLCPTKNVRIDSVCPKVGLKYKFSHVGLFIYIFNPPLTCFQCSPKIWADVNFTLSWLSIPSYFGSICKSRKQEMFPESALLYKKG